MNTKNTKELFENRYYDKKEISEILNVGMTAINNMIRKGKLTPIYLDREVRFNGISLNKEFNI